MVQYAFHVAHCSYVGYNVQLRHHHSLSVNHTGELANTEHLLGVVDEDVTTNVHNLYEQFSYPRYYLILILWYFADVSTYSNGFNYSGWRIQRVLIDYTSLMNKLLLYINSRYSCLSVRWTSEHLSKSQLFSRYLLVKSTVISMFLLSIYHKYGMRLQCKNFQIGIRYTSSIYAKSYRNNNIL